MGFVVSFVNAPILVATAVSLLLYLGARRCRYFGNTTPLLMVLAVFALRTTQTISFPWLWALPFLFTFVGGVFADALETKQRKLFLALTVALLATQVLLCLDTLPTLVRGI